LKNYLSLKEIQADISNGLISCESLVKHYLNKIESQKDLNIFLEVFSDTAIDAARLIDIKINEGKAGKLAGMVISIKDNICYQGHKVSAASKILDGFESLYSSTVVERLLKEDAIIIGRTNCDEFAMGSSNENSSLGNVKNPIAPNKVPGGSSGGSAASVTAGMCISSLGSDTGGSIRQPASFCGNIGLKPTYGRISRHGLIAYASSFDQIGPFTKSISDASIMLEVMSGADSYDSTASQKEVPNYSTIVSETKTKKRIAYFNSYVNHDGLNPEVKERTLEIINKLKEDGHEVDEINFDFLDQMVPAYYVLTTAEASSNLARYDGVHFGYRSESANNLLSTYVKSRSEGFGKEVKRRIMLGTYVLSAGYYDAYYTKAQKIRRLIKDKTNEVLSQYDFIISPTTPNTAFDIGSQNEDPIKMYLEDIFTVQANLSGMPAISLPLGNTKEELPFGIQLMGASFEEAELLSFSEYLINNH
jgi:aspartyl-tRNA(Asn)/glutamyl-tRNA(Gln) amidotransferase subunit A